MTQEELINVFKYIVKKCDILINNGNYEADAYTQDTVEDIAELCNRILDGDYGKLVEVKEVQEEPVSIWHDASKETPTPDSNILMVRKEEKDTNYPPIAGCFHGTNSRLDGRNWGYYNGFCYNEIEPPVKWAYIDDILNLSTVERTVKDQKEEPVSEELEEAAVEWFNSVKYKSDLSGTSINAFKAGAKWKELQIMSKAIDGEIGYWNLRGLSVNVELPLSVEEGDRVKVIVIEKE